MHDLTEQMTCTQDVKLLRSSPGVQLREAPASDVKKVSPGVHFQMKGTVDALDVDGDMECLVDASGVSPPASMRPCGYPPAVCCHPFQQCTRFSANGGMTTPREQLTSSHLTSLSAFTRTQSAYCRDPPGRSSGPDEHIRDEPRCTLLSAWAIDRSLTRHGH